MNTSLNAGVTKTALGFALQLCVLRYPGRVLHPGELIPSEVAFIAVQLGITVESLLPYAARSQTRHEHMTALRSIYGYRTFAGCAARALKVWLDGQAEEAGSNKALARRLVEECRRRQVILPAGSTLEPLCADAAVAADRRIEERIAGRPLERLEFLQRLGLSERIIEARHQPAMLEQAVSGKLGWDGLQDLVAVAERLTDTTSNGPLAYVAWGHGRLRRYAPRMLRALDIHAARVAKPLPEAASLIRDGRTHTEPRAFLRPASKWLWEVAVLSHLRDGFRSGDLWPPRSRRHGDPTQALGLLPVTTSDTALAVPLDAGEWLARPQAWMTLGLKKLAKWARTGAIPGGVIRDCGLNIDRLTAAIRVLASNRRSLSRRTQDRAARGHSVPAGRSWLWRQRRVRVTPALM